MRCPLQLTLDEVRILYEILLPASFSPRSEVREIVIKLHDELARCARLQNIPLSDILHEIE
jgi:hypothetical protein